MPDMIALVAKLDADVFENQLDNVPDIEYWNTFIKYNDKYYDMDVASFFDALPMIIRLCNDIIVYRGT